MILKNIQTSMRVIPFKINNERQEVNRSACTIITCSYAAIQFISKTCDASK